MSREKTLCYKNMSDINGLLKNAHLHRSPHPRPVRLRGLGLRKKRRILGDPVNAKLNEAGISQGKSLQRTFKYASGPLTNSPAWQEVAPYSSRRHSQDFGRLCIWAFLISLGKMDFDIWILKFHFDDDSLPKPLYL